ncbi:MAG: OmpH family outer membrane protein [Chlorobiaceae bacterium]|jgi:outer membrane protein|nr:OmpH family outer membrane protein [Chlorobiaceae bacterium]NTV16292.1 OmpH family outer membrane protein [Chlorobiaceae bacterium]
MINSRGFMKMSRRIIMAVGLSVVLGAPQSFAAQDTGKVSVVDSGKILQQLPETKQAEASLQATVTPLQKELDRLNQDYQKSIAAYRQEAGSLTKAARDQKEKELGTKAAAIEKYQQEKFGRGGVIEKKQQELLTPIRQKVLNAIESIAQKEGVGLVIEKNVAIFVTPDHDLTFKVMNQLNIK